MARCPEALMLLPSSWWRRALVSASNWVRSAEMKSLAGLVKSRICKSSMVWLLVSCQYKRLTDVAQLYLTIVIRVVIVQHYEPPRVLPLPCFPAPQVDAPGLREAVHHLDTVVVDGGPLSTLDMRPVVQLALGEMLTAAACPGQHWTPPRGW